MAFFLLGLFAAYLWGCWMLAGKYLTPHRYVAERPSYLERAEYGGTPCFVTPNLKSAPVVFVLAHGLGGNRSSFAEEAKVLMDHGYGAILPSMTGQDGNHADRIGFGSDESTLLAKICDEARDFPQHPKIVVGGVSMGGASAWLATEKTKVDGVITESAFADFSDAAGFYLNRAFPGGRYILAPVIWMGARRSRIDIAAIRPERAAASYHGPSVLIHAGDDQVVPLSHGERLAKAANSPLHIWKDANHAFCRQYRTADYDALFLGLAKRIEASGSVSE